MPKYIPEILSEVNEDHSKIDLYKNYPYVKVLFQYAFDPDRKFLLPEGEPPFKIAAEPLGMTPTNFIGEMRRLYIFTKDRADLNAFRRETLFVQLLETMHLSESKILVAIKDQNLETIYPNITAEFALTSGFISQEAYDTRVKNQEEEKLKKA